MKSIKFRMGLSRLLHRKSINNLEPTLSSVKFKWHFQAWFSSFLINFRHLMIINSFCQHYRLKCGAFEVKICEKTYKIKLIETAKDTIIKRDKINFVFLCYSIDSRVSYINVNKWIQENSGEDNDWSLKTVLVGKVWY